MRGSEFDSEALKHCAICLTNEVNIKHDVAVSRRADVYASLFNVARLGPFQQPTAQETHEAVVTGLMGTWS